MYNPSGKIKPVSPEKILIAGTDGGERSQGSVPVERWGNYARELIPGLTLYDTYQNLPLHIDEVKNTVAFARERISGNPDRILILGSGQNTIEISSIYKTFNGPEIVATDIQPKFLETLMKRLAKHNKKAFDRTYPLQMDIGKRWPKKITNGDGKEINLESVPLIFCNIVFNWLTEDEQKGVFKNVSERLTPNGDFILATLTNYWNSAEVKKHIPEQMRKNPFWTILGAMGSRKWADKTVQEFGIHRPSAEDIQKLAHDSGLAVKSIDGDKIFWRDRKGNPTAIVCHIKKE